MQLPLVLVGPMGSGKSTVGRALAAALGRPHVDTDECVERSAGRSIPEIFDSEGEAGFRRRESAALRDALAQRAVISTGGGVVVSADNRTLLRDAAGAVVWLDAEIDVLVERVGAGEGRPLLDGDVRERLAATVEARAAAYGEVADLHLDTTHMDPAGVVEAITAALDGAVA